MRVVVPPGQRLPRVSASISISRAEASELRDALDLVLKAGRSRWSASVLWAEIEADVTLMLEMDFPRNARNFESWLGPQKNAMVSKRRETLAPGRSSDDRAG
jgi:hypothetical protein